MLPKNISEINQYMCDPLNREGYMCSKFKNGYGPAAIIIFKYALSMPQRHMEGFIDLSVSQLHSNQCILSSHTHLSNLVALSLPHKKTYMNIADSILLSHMATLCYIIASLPGKTSRPRLFVPFMQMIISLPFMVVFLSTIYKMTQYGNTTSSALLKMFEKSCKS